jgi:hypothetical protein
MQNGRLAPDNLLTVDYGAVLKSLPARSDLGHLPRIAETEVGSLLAAPYSERENSQAKLATAGGRALLAPGELGQVAVLKMNRGFLQFMKANSEDDGTGGLRPIGAHPPVVPSAENAAL